MKIVTPLTKRRGVGVAVLASAMMLAACGGSPSGDKSAAPEAGKDIVLGGTFPQTGPLASYGALEKGFDAYLQKVNADGGVKGHKIVLKSMDDAYDPARAASNVRSLVQREKVFAVITFGGAPVVARDFLEQQQVPQFAFAGLHALSDVSKYHYTRSWWPDLVLEGSVVGQFLSEKLGMKDVSALTINNDAGHDLVKGVADNAGGGGYKLAEKQTYEPTDTEVATQVNAIRSASDSGIATLVTGTTEIAMLKYRAQVGLKSPTFLYSGASSTASVLKPAGKAAVGIYSPLWLKDPADPKWKADASLADYRATIEKYGKGADASDIVVGNGYGLAEALVESLKNADKLTPDALLKAWDTLPATKLDVLLPGVELKGNPKTGRPVQAYQVSQFDGTSWQSVGDVISQSDIRAPGH